MFCAAMQIVKPPGNRRFNQLLDQNHIGGSCGRSVKRHGAFTACIGGRPLNQAIREVSFSLFEQSHRRRDHWENYAIPPAPPR